MPTEVKQVITEITPKTFFPIHTEHPELYARFVSGVTKVQLPEKNKTAQVA
jgi:mRNA degradation ribonuclease J1/J2